jgi:hypothetical protein
MGNQSNDTKSIQGFGHPECYARELGGCCRQIDGEHYFSRAILKRIPEPNAETNKVLVQNLSFQKEPNTLTPLGVSSLVCNMLCNVHNTELSEYDAAGMGMFEAMEAIDNESRTPNPVGSTLIVDGDAFERWLLKAFIGGAYSGTVLVDGQSMKDTLPPLALLEILYRGAEFPAGQGLFWLSPEPGKTIVTDNLILKPYPIPSMDGKEVGAYSVYFFGFEFTLLMDGLAPGVLTLFDEGSYRPAGFEVVGCHTKIQFSWKNGPASPAISFFRLPHRTRRVS